MAEQPLYYQNVGALLMQVRSIAVPECVQVGVLS